MRKKILLYNPKAVFFDMPLALLAIGSALDASKYEVIIVDARVEDNPIGIIEKHIKEAMCFGVTVLTGKPIRDALQMSKKVKDLVPSIPIIWGGWHTSLFPKEVLQDERCVDITVQGQGEETFKELVEAIATETPLSKIHGITFKDNTGAVIKNPTRLMKSMDELADVNYGLIEVEKYFKKKGKRQLDYISSTGCYFRCSFCADPFVYGRKWTAISSEVMVNKLQELQNRYHFTDVNFQDETYFTYTNRVVEISNLIIEKRLRFTWAATMRADQGTRMTMDDFKICAKSGLRRLLIGVESGSQEMMDWLKKDIKIEQVFTCANRCKELGISVIFPFIIGFPEETKESVSSTVSLAKQLNGMSVNFSTPIFYFKPYPGSEITQEVVKKGYKLPDSTEKWADFDYIGSAGPWVDKDKFIFFENLKFYLKLAYSKQNIFFTPLQLLAKWRCSRNWFKFPLEKKVAILILSKQELS